MVQARVRPGSGARAARRRSGNSHEGIRKEQMATAKRKQPTCEDCWFRQQMLCALKLSDPCPTYRPADRGLAPERQLSFVFRSERTRTAYAFPPPR